MEKILRTVYNRPRLSKALRLVSHLAGIFAFCLFLYVFICSALSSPLSAAKLCITLGVSYVIVSLARKIINAPRPYEIYSFYEAPPKEKKGVSFPSRHTFLVFAIATLCLPMYPLPSVILFILGGLLAVSRVLIGIHFIRDVLCGALLGVVSSLIGLFTLFPYT